MILITRVCDGTGLSPDIFLGVSIFGLGIEISYPSVALECEGRRGREARQSKISTVGTGSSHKGDVTLHRVFALRFEIVSSTTQAAYLKHSGQ